MLTDLQRSYRMVVRNALHSFKWIKAPVGICCYCGGQSAYKDTRLCKECTRVWDFYELGILFHDVAKRFGSEGITYGYAAEKETISFIKCHLKYKQFKKYFCKSQQEAMIRELS